MIIEIIEFMREIGMKASRETIVKIYEYLFEMMKAGRIITFRENDKLIGFCTYTMCDSVEVVYEKDIWDDEALGAYIEMIVCSRWTKKLREMLEKAIASKYPNFEYGAWHRPGQDDDRILIVNRRYHVPSKHTE